jgi:hypothetical protein
MTKKEILAILKGRSPSQRLYIQRKVLERWGVPGDLMKDYGQETPVPVLVKDLERLLKKKKEKPEETPGDDCGKE